MIHCSMYIEREVNSPIKWILMRNIKHYGVYIKHRQLVVLKNGSKVIVINLYIALQLQVMKCCSTKKHATNKLIN